MRYKINKEIYYSPKSNTIIIPTKKDLKFKYLKVIKVDTKKKSIELDLVIEKNKQEYFWIGYFD